MFSVNLVKNGSFEDNLISWSPHPSEAENLIEIESENAQNGTKCAKLSTTKAGQSRLQQTLKLIGGKTYTLSFYAKRTGSIDVWVSYLPSGGGWNPLPSRRNDITDTYQRIDQEICVNATGVIDVVIAIIAGSLPGTAWIDNVSLMEDLNLKTSFNQPNQLANSSFSSGSDHWTYSSGVYRIFDSDKSFHCMSFPNVSSNFFEKSISQNTKLRPGTTYNLSYQICCLHGDAKVALRIAYINNNDETTYLDYSAQTGFPGIYTYRTTPVTIPLDCASSSIQISLMVACNSGDNCEVRIRDVELYGNTAGDLLRTTISQVQVRNNPSTSSQSTRVVEGSILPIKGYALGDTINGSPLWYKVSWCAYSNAALHVRTRYVHSSVAEEITNSSINTKLEKVVAIAKSLVGNSGANLNLSGEWCQSFINWLCVVAEVDPSRFPMNEFLTPNAADWLQERGHYWSMNGVIVPVPQPGDWIYYLNKGSSDAMSHVGLVVHRDGNTLTCIEGNLGANGENNLVQQVSIDDYTAPYVIVNKTPKYIKGIARINYQ